MIFRILNIMWHLFYLWKCILSPKFICTYNLWFKNVTANTLVKKKTTFFLGLET